MSCTFQKIEVHDRERRERFFDALRQIYDFRSYTPQWNGTWARELYLFPKEMPDGSL